MSGVQVHDDGGVRWVVFDRPERKNAMTSAMYAAIDGALAGAAADPSIAAVVLTGAGGAFTAGNDLGDFRDKRPDEIAGPVFGFLEALIRFPKPVIAAVEGVAVGVGTTMLLHCDLVYAAEDARFVLPFVNLGLIPEAASSLLLPQRAGHALASELLLFGEPFDAATALRAGIAHEVVPRGQLRVRVQDRARQLADKPLNSLIQTKALLKRASLQPTLETMAYEGGFFTELLQAPEAKEAFAAFFERRKPDFRKLRG